VKIATWNVNSIRIRLPRLLDWLGRAEPDVVCLQELKVADDQFPIDAIRALGYDAVWHGQRTYNGVAILSRSPLTDVRIGFGDGAPGVPAGAGGDDAARLITATVAGLRIISAYFPNGQVVGSEKWLYKLAWIGRFKDHLATAHNPAEPLLVCGDFNVAPDDRDVARPDEWRNTVLCHTDARLALQQVAGWGLIDTMRIHESGPGPYTWWDYRMLGFAKGNGLRIDHIFATQPVVARLTRVWVERNERKGKLPSDHAPVVAELD
jgi:exodeoxyribonuclease-3